MKTNLLSKFLFTAYLFYLFSPVSSELPHLKWYMLLSLSLLCFLINRFKFSLTSTKLYSTVYILYIIGAFFALLRNPTSTTTTNAIGIIIIFLTYLLFHSILDSNGRKYLLLSILLSSLLWTFEIQELVNYYSTLHYSAFGDTGTNKNMVGFLFVISIVTLFYFFLRYNWPPNRMYYLIKFGLLFFIIYLAFNLFLIYDRSAIITLTVGVMVALYKTKKTGMSIYLYYTIVLGALFYFAISYILPGIISISPKWLDYYYLVTDYGISSFDSRYILIQKGIYIIMQNPIIGVGISGSRDAIAHFPGFLIHNNWLSDWAELGIFGLIADLILIRYIYIMLKREFFSKLNLVDQSWLIICVPFVIESFFKELAGFRIILLIIISSIYSSNFISKEYDKNGEYY